MTRFVNTIGPFPAEPFEQIAPGLTPDEARTVNEVAARDDTATIVILDDAGTVLGWLVYGPSDPPNEVVLYAGRAEQNGMARIMLRSMFGVSQIMGQPMRMHTDKFAQYARMIGAPYATAAVDADGLPMGVFHGVQ